LTRFVKGVVQIIELDDPFIILFQPFFAAVKNIVNVIQIFQFRTDITYLFVDVAVQ